MEWISVETALPERIKNVLGLVEYDFDGKHYRHHKIVYHTGNGKWEPLGRETDKVTYWSELPPPPKED